MDTVILDTINKLALFLGIGALVYIGKQLQQLKILNKTVETIKWNLKVVTDHLTKSNSAQFNSRELKNYSPLKLTDTGYQLIDQLNFREIFQKHKKDFFAFIDGEKPNLKYDVEVSALKSILVLSNKIYMNPIKIFLYNNQERTLENLSPTLGMFVRDEYLRAHPEIQE